MWWLVLKFKKNAGNEDILKTHLEAYIKELDLLTIVREENGSIAITITKIKTWNRITERQKF